LHGVGGFLLDFPALEKTRQTSSAKAIKAPTNNNALVPVNHAAKEPAMTATRAGPARHIRHSGATTTAATSIPTGRSDMRFIPPSIFTPILSIGRSFLDQA
jgi:hypothetical protein